MLIAQLSDERLKGERLDGCVHRPIQAALHLWRVGAGLATHLYCIGTYGGPGWLA